MCPAAAGNRERQAVATIQSYHHARVRPFEKHSSSASIFPHKGRFEEAGQPENLAFVSSFRRPVASHGMGPPHGWCFPASLVHDNAPVRSNYLSTRRILIVRSTDSALARFLDTQRDLRDLALHSVTTQPSFKLASNALPLLDSFGTLYVSAVLSEVTYLFREWSPSCLLTSMKIIAARPVQNVALAFRGKEDYPLLDVLRQTSKPVRRFFAVLVTCGHPVEFLVYLGGLCRHLVVLNVIAFDRQDYTSVRAYCAPSIFRIIAAH